MIKILHGSDLNNTINIWNKSVPYLTPTYNWWEPSHLPKAEKKSFLLYFRNAALISILRGINHKLKTIKIETEKAEKR